VRRETPTSDFGELSAAAHAPSLVDQVITSLQARTLLEHLAALDDPDLLVIWRHAEGVSDVEIQAEWELAGYRPREPSLGYIRKRRERARTRLRRLLDVAEGARDS
jgi:hypothetical protein